MLKFSCELQAMSPHRWGTYSIKSKWIIDDGRQMQYSKLYM